MMAELPEIEAGIEGLRPRLHRLFSARQAGHLAEDLASETILRVLTALRRGDQIQNLPAYAAGTARRVLLEHYRSRDERMTPFTPEAEEVTPGPEPDSAEADSPEEGDLRIARLRACLGQLPPEERALLSAYYADGNNKANRAHIAITMGITPNALHIRASRARRTLRLCAGSASGGVVPALKGATSERFSGRNAPQSGGA